MVFNEAAALALLVWYSSECENFSDFGIGVFAKSLADKGLNAEILSEHKGFQLGVRIAATLGCEKTKENLQIQNLFDQYFLKPQVKDINDIYYNVRVNMGILLQFANVCDDSALKNFAKEVQIKRSLKVEELSIDEGFTSGYRIAETLDCLQMKTLLYDVGFL